eukprot:scaffold1034_cov127-Cylindrotheca_fusiformis.AAC.22
MPRLGGGTFGQSYLINLSDDGADDAGPEDEQTIQPAPTSAPRDNAPSPMASGILRNGPSESSFGLSPRLGHKRGMELPTTVSIDAQATQRTNRTQVRAAESAGSSLTPRIRRQVSMDLPTTIDNESEQIPQKKNRIKVRAAESALGPLSSPSGRRREAKMRLPTTRVSSDSDAVNTAPAKKQIWRAAEAGSTPVLPEFVPAPSSSNHRRRHAAPPKRGPPDRSKTRSTPSLRKMVIRGMNGSSTPSLPQTQHDTTQPPLPSRKALGNGVGALRRRTPSTAASDDEDLLSWRSRDTDSPYRFTRSRKHGTMYNLKNLSRMKVGHILQFFIVLAVTLLVYESHSKAIFAADQLSQFKEEESLLLLHLQKIEQQSIQLHENLSRLAQSGGAEAVEEKKAENEDVDFELIHKQTQQLYQMEEELNHEVRTLQTKIQQSARNHIIQEFGEGPVQVILELDFGNEGGPNQIAILLWHDTPHAAWTWLEQIRRHVWDEAEFKWQQSHIIDAIPTRADHHGGGRIEFVEQSQHGHEPWTVGLRESDVGDLQMYFNLQDNVNIHKHEVCVGKVIDGFDSLQHLLEVSRNKKFDDNYSIQIRKATAMHVTKLENI